VLKDIELIKSVTGVKEVRYEDVLYLKRIIRDVMFNKDARNI
jgi:hypothetical protein